MPIPLEVSFHGVPPSAALRDRIARHVAKLERLAPNAISCYVTVEYAGQRHHKGNRYRVHARLLVPGAELNAGLAAPLNGAHEDPYVVVRDSFDALRRQLEDRVSRERGEVKGHVPPPHGRIARIFPAADYGVIATGDGREIHFHRHSVVDASFDQLDVGREVRFTEVAGDEGPWASTVHPVGKHHGPELQEAPEARG